VIIHQSARLHVSIDHRASNKFKTALDQVFTQRIRFFGGGWHWFDRLGFRLLGARRWLRPGIKLLGFVQHPALEGLDGIALDKLGNIWGVANERNEVIVVSPFGPE